MRILVNAGGDALQFILEMQAAGLALDEADRPVELETAEAREVVSLFWKLHGSRSSTGWGPAGISYADLFYYQTVTGEKLSWWQTEQIRMIDSIFLNALADAMKQRGE
jgi:hypothetical protein